MKKLITLLALFSFGLKIIYAQVGKVDSLFGNKGIVTTDLGSTIRYNGYGKQVLVTPDGSLYIIISMEGKTILSRKQANGSTDLTYGHNGFSVKIDISDAHAALQKDGKVIIAGKKSAIYSSGDVDKYAFTLARLNSDGSQDKTFGGAYGYTLTNIAYHYDAINSLAIDNNGLIVVSGFSSDADDYETNPDGTPLHPVGHLSIARYDSNGSLVSLFDETGNGTTKFQTYTATSNLLAIQANGKIVITGAGDSGLILARYNSDQSLDNTFKISDHLKINDSSYFVATSMGIQNDGKIVIGGLWQNKPMDFVVVRFNQDGKLDSTFSSDGIQTTDFKTYNDVITSVAIQADNKILAAGYASNGINYGFAIARYTSNGSLDNTFNSNGKRMTFIGPDDIFGNSVALQPDGKIIIAGYSTLNTINTVKIAKYKTNGSMDSSFGSKGTLTDSLKQRKTVFTCTAIQPDNKIVAAGYAWNGANYDFAVARYLADGRLDNTFSSDGLLLTDVSSDDFARALAIQSNGKIIVGGKTLVRYNTDGSLDNTFNNTGKQTPDFEVFFIKVQTDGKIIVAGGENLARYNSNGSVDLSFNGTGKVSTIAIKDIALQSDGKIVLVNDAFEIRRYNTDGSFNGGNNDGKFEKIDFFRDYVDNGTFDNIYQISASVAIQSDGKIVVSGNAGGDARNGYFLNSAIARYNINGKLDSTFSGTGMKIIYLDRNTLNSSILIQSDDKIVVKSTFYFNETGYFSYEVVSRGYVFTRLLTDGNMDFDFGTDGATYVDIDNVLLNTAIGDNKFYVVGYGKHISEFGFLSRYLLNVNKAPSVSLTSPASNATYQSPATIVLSAAAVAAEGTVKFVQFYSNGILLNTDSTSPYSYTINNLPPGTYSFVAKATAGNTLTANSASVAVSVSAPVNKAPVVNITSPANNAIYLPSAAITVNASASDSDGTIAYVKFFNGSTLLKTDSISPYDYTLNSAAAGNYKFYAKATDNKGLASSSKTVCVFVTSGSANKTPEVTLTGPANNATYSAPATIVLKATASDADGTITSVQFYNGGTLLSTDSTSPYSYTLNNAPAGNYSFAAKATDNKGYTNNSASLAVSVSTPANKAPAINITAPDNNSVYYAPASINLEAVASDADGTISTVKFYSGSTLLKTDSTSPYTCTVNNLAAGYYSYTAKATDNKGLSASSATVHLSVLPNEAPTVYLNNYYTIYTVPPTITLSAGPSDADGTITYVDFYNGDTLLNRDSISPYGFIWTNVPAGIYSLTARATDNHGLTGISDTTVINFTPEFNLEAEDAVLAGPVLSTSVPGFTGYGYADFVHASGDFVDWTVVKSSIAQSYLLKFRYANGSTNRPLRVEVNGVVVKASLDFPSTGSWSAWSVASTTANLIVGTNTVKLTSIGSNGPNVDNLSISANTGTAAKDAVSKGGAIAGDVQKPVSGKRILPASSHVLKVLVTPNPVSDNGKLILTTSSNLPVNFRLVDILGRSFKSIKFLPGGSNVFNFSTKNLLPGSYNIIVKQGNVSAHARLIVVGKSN